MARGPGEAAQAARLLGAPIVTVAGRLFSGRDVVSAALVAGLWEPLEREVVAGEMARRAEPPSPEAVAAAVKEFRYAHRLIAGDELRAWLSKRELTLEALRDSCARRVALDAEAERAAGPAGPAATVTPDVMLVDAVISGVVADAARWLAERVLALGEVQPSDRDRAEAETWLEREDALVVARAFATEARTLREERLSTLIAGDRAHGEQSREQLDARALRTAVNRHRLDWLTVETEDLSTSHAGAAAEMAALLREGAAAQRVAQLSGSPVRLHTRRLDSSPAGLQGALVSAAVGDTLGPIDLEGTLTVSRVLARISPTVEDPDVVELAGAEILSEYWQARCAGQLRWHGRH